MKLEDANTFAEIVDVLARRCWWNWHGNNETGKNCPSNMIPSPHDLAEFVGYSNVMYAAPTESGGHQDVLHANDEMERSIGFAMRMMRHFAGMAGVGLHYIRREAPHCEEVCMSAPDIKETIERFHAQWMMWETTRADVNAKAERHWKATRRAWEMQAAGGRLDEFTEEQADESMKMEPIPHYAQTLIDMWQRSPRKAEPFVPKNKGSIPRLARVTKGEVDTLPVLPRMYGGADIDESSNQLELLPSAIAPKGDAFWLVRLFQAVGGTTMRRGKGAPWELRLFIGALLHLGVAQRDGQWHTLDIPTADVIRWLHGDEWQNKRRDWHKLPEALFAIRNGLNAVAVPGIGSVQIMSVPVIPLVPTDPLVRFAVMVPPSAAHGIKIDWPTMCAYGKVSAPIFCAYLASQAALDVSAHKGSAITRTIGAPVRDADGKTLRRKGRVKRDHGKQVANPAAQFVRSYSKHDLTRMAGMDPSNKVHRHRALAAFEHLHNDGVIEMHRDGNHWRIFARHPQQLPTDAARVIAQP